MNLKNYYLKLLISLYKKYISYVIAKSNNINEVLIISKNEFFYELVVGLFKNSIFQGKLLNDICIVDLPEKQNRFELIYNVTSIRYNFRFFFKTFTNAYIPSLSTVFKSAN
jgi:NADH:ubiquinone oxidoreductase subunit C